MMVASSFEVLIEVIDLNYYLYFVVLLPLIEHIEVYVEGAFEAAIAHPSAEETPG